MSASNIAGADACKIKCQDQTPAYAPLSSTVRSQVPYALTFSKAVQVTDSGQYINDCCIGGDVVLDQLLPTLRKRYPGASAIQEDWGWFSWFDFEGTKLAVDVHTLEQNSFQIHLTSRKSRFLLPAKVVDVPE